MALMLFVPRSRSQACKTHIDRADRVETPPEGKRHTAWARQSAHGAHSRSRALPACYGARPVTFNPTISPLRRLVMNRILSPALMPVSKPGRATGYAISIAPMNPLMSSWLIVSRCRMRLAARVSLDAMRQGVHARRGGHRRRNGEGQVGIDHG